jgi:hypothetical protein
MTPEDKAWLVAVEKAARNPDFLLKEEVYRRMCDLQVQRRNEQELAALEHEVEGRRHAAETGQGSWRAVGEAIGRLGQLRKQLGMC